MIEIPTVTLCLIVKNEAENLPKCLASIKGFDRCLVVDTGSTDGTVEIAKSLGADVVHFDWCDDFSKARNVWHEHVKKGWIFWLDADDEIPSDLPVAILELGAAAPEDVLAFRFNYVYPDGYKVDHMRMYRADRGIRWFRRIHEGLRLWDHEGRTMHSNWSVYHTGYHAEDRAAMEAKKARNEAILLKELEDDPCSALDWQYLACHRQGEGKHQEAVEMFQKALAYGNPQRDLTWLPEVYMNMARSYVKLGKRGQAKKIMERGVRECGSRAFAYFADAQLGRKAKDGRTLGDNARDAYHALRSLR